MCQAPICHHVWNFNELLKPERQIGPWTWQFLKSKVTIFSFQLIVLFIFLSIWNPSCVMKTSAWPPRRPILLTYQIWPFRFLSSVLITCPENFKWLSPFILRQCICMYVFENVLRINNARQSYLESNSYHETIVNTYMRFIG